MTDEKEEQLKVIREHLAKNADEMQAIKGLQNALKLSSKVLKSLDSDGKIPKTWRECLEDTLAIGDSLQSIYYYQEHIDEYDLEAYEKTLMRQACLEAINAFGSYLPTLIDIQNDLYEEAKEKEGDK